MCQRDISLWMVEFMKFEISTEMGYDPYIPFENSLSQSHEDNDFTDNIFRKNNFKNTMFCEDDFIDEICCSSLKFGENNFINNIFSENESTVNNLVFTNEDGFTVTCEFTNDFVFTDENGFNIKYNIPEEDCFITEENGFNIKYNIPEEDCFITKVCPYAKNSPLSKNKF